MPAFLEIMYQSLHSYMIVYLSKIKLKTKNIKLFYFLALCACLCARDALVLFFLILKYSIFTLTTSPFKDRMLGEAVLKSYAQNRQ